MEDLWIVHSRQINFNQNWMLFSNGLNYPCVGVCKTICWIKIHCWLSMCQYHLASFLFFFALHVMYMLMIHIHNYMRCEYALDEELFIKCTGECMISISTLYWFHYNTFCHRFRRGKKSKFYAIKKGKGEENVCVCFWCWKSSPNLHELPFRKLYFFSALAQSLPTFFFFYFHFEPIYNSKVIVCVCVKEKHLKLCTHWI